MGPCVTPSMTFSVLKLHSSSASCPDPDSDPFTCQKCPGVVALLRAVCSPQP